MLQMLDRRGVKAIRNELREVFAARGHEVHHRRLTFPGGAIPNAKLYWRPDLGLWGYFADTPSGRQPRWLCWFGTTIGVKGKPLGASIEINLPLDSAHRQVAGRPLSDADGRFYLGHKGGLGGGRGGQMRVAEFAGRIKGFVREPILLTGDKEEHVFVIGALDAPNFLPRLLAYVRECERLRAFANMRAADGSGTDDSDDGTEDDGRGQGGRFNPQNGKDGTGNGHPGDTYTIRRLHGRVVNALQKALGPKAINDTHLEMRPDLYIRTSSDLMEVLFEVKASSDTQSWFTALGQLVVYGAGQTPPPQRVLVCPAIRQDPNFQKALAQLDVTVITFQEGKSGRITFSGLETLRLP